jgi:ribosomal protein S12 methylthiotransferase
MGDHSFYLVTLGCAKNTVDADSMAQLLERDGLQPASDPDEADVLVVNTCGFIEPAREESLTVLRELAASKREGQLLIAAGCLTQRYGQQVTAWVPGIDGVLGTRRWMDIVTLLRKLRRSEHPKPLYHLPEVPTVGSDEVGVARVAARGASAYVKIADGCRRPCAFCAIPLIKGPAVSRSADAIVDEVRMLREHGIEEVILIAQDTTDYGSDLGMTDGLSQLLELLVSAVPDLPWLRVLYAYPGYLTDRLIDVMAGSAQILDYLDMPLQHAHPDTLRRMQRPANVDWVDRTLEKVRGAMPDVALRTTMIVGYPGETEEEFETLLEFVERTRFDRLGAFKYSFERGTPAEPLGDPVPEELKQERYDRLMTLQREVSLSRNQAQVGRTLDVLVEGRGDGVSVGRSYRDAPEIDGLVLVEEELEVGSLTPVQITGAMVYDLAGRPATS